jgi:hypothetical protein
MTRFSFVHPLRGSKVPRQTWPEKAGQSTVLQLCKDRNRVYYRRRTPAIYITGFASAFTVSAQIRN